MSIKKLGFTKKLRRQLVTFALAGAITMGTLFGGGISYATDAFPVIEYKDVSNGKGSVKFPVKTYEYSPTTKWRVFEHVGITENHRKLLKDLRTNLDSVKAGKNLDTSLINTKALLEQLLVQVNNHSLGRPQELLDALRYTMDTLDTMSQKDFTEKNRKNWQNARKALTNINKRLKFPNSRIVVYLDGMELYADDVQAQVIGGRTMIPLRALGDALGMLVEWDGATKTAIFTGNKNGYFLAKNGRYEYDGVQIKVKIGSDTIEATHYECAFKEGTKELVAVPAHNFEDRDAFGTKNVVTPQNGKTYKKTVKMDVVPQAVNGRIMIPARFFMEAYYDLADAMWSAELRDRLKNVSGGYNLVSLYSSAIFFGESNGYHSGMKMEGKVTAAENEARNKAAKEVINLMNAVDIEMYANELRPVERDAYKLLSQRRTATERIAEHLSKGGVPNTGDVYGVFSKGYGNGGYGKDEKYLGDNWKFLAGKDMYSDGPLKFMFGSGVRRYPLPLAYSVARVGYWSSMYGVDYTKPETIDAMVERRRVFAPNFEGKLYFDNKIIADSRLAGLTDFDFFHIENNKYVLDNVEYYSGIYNSFYQGILVLDYGRDDSIFPLYYGTDEFIKFE